MATIQGVNVNTGAVELPKYNDSGVTNQIYVANVTTALAAADVILGPVIPANTFITGMKVDVDKLDSAGSPAVTFELGYINAGTTTAAAFIATGNTTAQAGGIQSANVAGTTGATFTNNVTIAATITNTAGTAVAGKFRISADYTASP